VLLLPPATKGVHPPLASAVTSRLTIGERGPWSASTTPAGGWLSAYSRPCTSVQVLPTPSPFITVTGTSRAPGLTCATSAAR